MPCTCKPNSVPQKAEIIIYLGNALLHSSSGTSRKRDTALHAGKDLAVSLLAFPQEFTPKGALIFRSRASLFAPRRLLSAGVTRYRAALPKQSACSDFPPFAKTKSNYPIQDKSTIPFLSFYNNTSHLTFCHKLQTGIKRGVFKSEW